MLTSIRIVIRAGRQWSANGDSRLGAALAYYALFSIAHLLVIAVTIAGAVFGEEISFRPRTVGSVPRGRLLAPPLSNIKPGWRWGQLTFCRSLRLDRCRSCPRQKANCPRGPLRPRRRPRRRR